MVILILSADQGIPWPFIWREILSFMWWITSFFSSFGDNWISWMIRILCEIEIFFAKLKSSLRKLRHWEAARLFGITSWDRKLKWNVLRLPDMFAKLVHLFTLPKLFLSNFRWSEYKRAKFICKQFVVYDVKTPNLVKHTHICICRQ